MLAVSAGMLVEHCVDDMIGAERTTTNVWIEIVETVSEHLRLESPELQVATAIAKACASTSEVFPSII